MRYNRTVLHLPSFTLRRFIIVVLSIIASIIVIAFVAVLVVFSSADRGVLFSRYKHFEFNGTQRDYLLHVPKDITDDTRIVLGLHGFGGNGRQFAYYTALHNADSNDIIVYPSATKPTADAPKTGWNAGFCCGSGWLGNVDDIGFLTSLAASISSEYKLENKAVFAVGFSNGAFMAQRLAAERPDFFTAAVSGSGTIGSAENSLQPSAPVPILLMHGKKDTIVPFEGGAGSTDPDFEWISHDDTVAAWTAANGEIAPTVERIYEHDSHQWHDWRLTNFWHRLPQGSIEAVEFMRDL